MITTIESAFLIVSLVSLVPLLAVQGVVISRFVAALAMFLCSFFVLRKHMQVTFPLRRLAVSGFVSAAMMATILVGVLSQDNLLFTPLFALAGVAVFLLLTWLFQAKEFFATLEQTLPFELPAPLRRIMRRRQHPL